MAKETGAGASARTGTRTEVDRLGALELPADCLYGIQTERARRNFDLGGRPANSRLMAAIVKVKKAAADTHAKIEADRAEVFRAISLACDEALSGKAEGMFVVEALQGGAGTSANMNVN